jgi:hypothetical protein
MATTRNDTPSTDLEAAEAELLDRLVASAAGLPHVCILKRCRRRKRCLGPAVDGVLTCKRHHRGLARARFRSALAVLGWPNRDSAGNPIVRQSAVGNRQS